MPAAISVDAKQVGRIARGIRRASPEAWRATRVRLRAVGQIVADDAKQRTSYSTRIPGAIKVNTTAAGNVRVSVTGDPGVPIENKGRGYVRHPTFGHRDRFTDKNSHPAFLLPAFAEKREWALAEIEKTYLDVFERVWGSGT